MNRSTTSNSSAKVLLLGNQRAHLEARASILRHFWTIGIAAVDEVELPLLDANLVVVCHTLPEPERNEWVQRVRQVEPTMLIVRMNGFDCGPHAGADATVDVRHGPGALVATIYELLMERGLPSRDWPERETVLAVH
jgi:hypothetical protein